VDELRRESSMVHLALKRGIAFYVEEDTCVVEPGKLSTRADKQLAVYSPWLRAWLAYLHGNPNELKMFETPSANAVEVRDRYSELFSIDIPTAPDNKTLTSEEHERFRSLWPAGERAALARLRKFLDQRVNEYGEERSFPAANSTSMLSGHLAAGTLSARTAVIIAKDMNSTQRLDTGNE
jgi:deoxyribodipyrimidine photo-lyase